MTKINKFSLKKDYIENEKFFLRCIIPDLKYSSYAKKSKVIKMINVILSIRSIAYKKSSN